MGRARQWQKSGIPTWVLWPSVIFVLVTYVAPGLFASYRAWIQVRSLELIVAGTVKTLAERVIPDNHNASIDPRWKRDLIVVVLTQPLLAGYNRGAATLRGSAIGGPQWLRTPPPLICERPVTLP